MRTLFLLAFAASFTACKKSGINPTPEFAVNKTISFELYALKDYSEAIFDNSHAQVHLNITKLNLKTNTVAVYWDTIVAMRQLKEYPQFNQRLVLEKLVPHFEDSEILQASKEVRYRSNGSVSMEAFGEPVLKGELRKQVAVTL